VIDDAQRFALQRLQCLRLRSSETRVSHWAGVLQDWPDHGAVKTQQVVPPGARTFQLLKEVKSRMMMITMIRRALYRSRHECRRNRSRLGKMTEKCKVISTAETNGMQVRL